MRAINDKGREFLEQMILKGYITVSHLNEKGEFAYELGPEPPDDEPEAKKFWHLVNLVIEIKKIQHDKQAAGDY